MLALPVTYLQRCFQLRLPVLGSAEIIAFGELVRLAFFRAISGADGHPCKGQWTLKAFIAQLQTWMHATFAGTRAKRRRIS